MAAVLPAVLTACGGGAVTTYDLSTVIPFKASAARDGWSAGGQMAVAKPLAIQMFSGNEILVKSAGGTISRVGGAQWVDQLPELVQTRLVQSFENSAGLRSVFKTGAGLTSDYLLSTEIREFYIDEARGAAVVELSVRLVADTSGRVVRAKVFRAEYPASAGDGAAAVTGLDQALSAVMADIVRWVTGRRR
jgi:cholesterol transport system auxiliary component